MDYQYKNRYSALNEQNKKKCSSKFIKEKRNHALLPPNYELIKIKIIFYLLYSSFSITKKL